MQVCVVILPAGAQPARCAEPPSGITQSSFRPGQADSWLRASLSPDL